MSVKKLGIVVPLANEERTIDELLTRILKHAPQGRVFCVLDRVSKDHTLQKVTEWSQRDPRVVLVWAPENRCVVDAYFRGYKAALEDGCDWILEMDGGLSHRPEEIPRFLDAMEQGFDFAGGSRFMKGGRYIQPRFRYLISLLGTWLTNFLVRTKMKDMTSGFECFTREVLERVVAQGVRSRAHFFQTEIRTRMHDFRWTEIPITYRNPSSHVGSSNLKEAFKNLAMLWRERGSPLNFLGFLFFALCGLTAFCVLLFAPMRDVVLRFLQDDAFYYFEIASNWFRFHFSTFDSINPTNGYHPLWLWLLIFPSALFSDMELFVRGGAAAGVALLLGGGFLATRSFQSESHAGSTDISWVWLAGSLIFSSLYGMESLLCVFLLGALLYALPKRREEVTLKTALWCGLLSGLLFLTRLDTLIWLAALDVLMLALVLRYRAEARRFLPPFFLFGFAQGLMILAYFLYNRFVWGHWMTVSAMVKTGRADLLSMNLPLSLLLFIALFITVLSILIFLHFTVAYVRARDTKTLMTLSIPAWLSLSNLLYMTAIFLKGGAETFNWYFGLVVFSGVVLVPFFIHHDPVFRVPLSVRTKRRLSILGCFVLLLATLNGLRVPSGFVGAYDRAMNLAQLPEGSVVFASGDCGILGTLSNQHCLNLDGLTNSFEFQEALREDRLAEWLESSGLNAYFTSKEDPAMNTVTLQALPGIYGVGRSVELELSPWIDETSESFNAIRLYTVEGIQ